jgi:ABC-type phosphate/phosphonate transport system substrate-binding protein
MKTDDATYIKSNTVVAVALSKFSKKEFQAVLNSNETAANRQKTAQSLCDYLCGKFKMPRVSVVVTDRAQPHSTNSRGSLHSKTLGNYAPLSMVITLFNKTAVKRQIVAIKTLADTLLHEFIHHYDYTRLNLGASPHTAGFYRRIGDLKTKLS